MSSSPNSTQHTTYDIKVRKHVLLNVFLKKFSWLYFFPFTRAVPFGVPDAGWHQLREATGADAWKEKSLPWFISVSSFAAIGEGRRTRVMPKQPVVGETTGEGCQLGEYRGQLTYFDLNFQKRIKDSWIHTSKGLCVDIWACCFSYRAQSLGPSKTFPAITPLLVSTN